MRPDARVFALLCFPVQEHGCSARPPGPGGVVGGDAPDRRQAPRHQDAGREYCCVLWQQQGLRLQGVRFGWWVDQDLCTHRSHRQGVLCFAGNCSNPGQGRGGWRRRVSVGHSVALHYFRLVLHLCRRRPAAAARTGVVCTSRLLDGRCLLVCDTGGHAAVAHRPSGALWGARPTTEAQQTKK